MNVQLVPYTQALLNIKNRPFWRLRTVSSTKSETSVYNRNGKSELVESLACEFCKSFLTGCVLFISISFSKQLVKRFCNLRIARDKPAMVISQANYLIWASTLDMIRWLLSSLGLEIHLQQTQHVLNNTLPSSKERVSVSNYVYDLPYNKKLVRHLKILL